MAVEINDIVYLEAGDTVNIRGLQASGGDLDLDTTARYNSMSIAWLGE